ncbi:MAG: hypothetical protein FWH12_07265 [Treponema sp.]|nr:hypothetical protein [Treponema sp.]
MPKNLPALFSSLFLLLVLLGGPAVLSAQEGPPSLGAVSTFEQTRAQAGEPSWYRSNRSGMALELNPSPMAALRNQYALSIETIEPSQHLLIIPEILLPYYDISYEVERRQLYQDGEEFRDQWIFREEGGLVRITSSGNRALFFGGEDSPLGFIEVRNEEGSVTAEIRYEEDASQWAYYYSYADNLLLSSETWYSPPPEDEGDASQDFVLLTRDLYRYSRSGSLRAIDRNLAEGAGDLISRLSFPQAGMGFSFGDDFLVRGFGYSSDFMFHLRGYDGAQISYTLDSRGRVLHELWRNPEGEFLGELNNIWSDDRLMSIIWTAPGQERIVEFDYDREGNRIAERNFNQGVLERLVISHDDSDTEEIYMNGILILRAYWEGGLKVAEERIAPGLSP